MHAWLACFAIYDVRAMNRTNRCPARRLQLNLKLYYFNIPFWRAEVSRISLHLAGIPFEDIRISGHEFMAMKSEGQLPFGQVPIMDVDETRIAQTGAIARFCGKLAGLYPIDDALKAAQIDQFIDAATEITELFRPTMFIKDEKAKLLARQKIAETSLPTCLSYLKTRLGCPHHVITWLRHPHHCGFSNLATYRMAFKRCFRWYSPHCHRALS